MFKNNNQALKDLSSNEIRNSTSFVKSVGENLQYLIKDEIQQANHNFVLEVNPLERHPLKEAEIPQNKEKCIA